MTGGRSAKGRTRCSVIVAPWFVGCTGGPADSGAGSNQDVQPTAAEWLEPGERGPWSVGTDAFGVVGSDGLSLEVQVWYPSAETSAEMHTYGGIFPSDGALDATTADCAEVHPVLAFSHGNSAINYQSFFLVEHLASQGWVVVAPNHRGNTLWDNHEDKIALALRRPIDIRDSVDWLFEDLAGPAGDFAGCVDTDAGYAISGHSFGGFTTLATAGATVDLDAAIEFCADADEWMCTDLANWEMDGGEMGVHDLADPRVWAAMPMAHAGYEVVYTGLPEIRVPSLVMGGGLDTGTTMEWQIQPAYDAMISSKPRYLAEIENAGHFAFSDACEILSGMAAGECEEPYVEPDLAHQMINTWMSAFLQQVQGKGDASAYMPGDFSDVRWEEQGFD